MPSSIGGGSSGTLRRARSSRIGESSTNSLRTTLNSTSQGSQSTTCARILKRWENRSSATRANVVSVLHSFFGWAVAEDLIEIDPSAPLRRPKKRRADIYRPSVDELDAVRAAALPHERPAILLMEGAGLRRSEVLHVR